jgi:sec-independent protein translocase protein TatB
MEAAAPVAPAITDGTENTIAPAATEEFLVGHPHEQPQAAESAPAESAPAESAPAESTPAPEPLPIATSGDLNLMPPSTGLPVSNSALSPVLDSIPHEPDPAADGSEVVTSEATQRV